MCVCHMFIKVLDDDDDVELEIFVEEMSAQQLENSIKTTNIIQCELFT